MSTEITNPIPDVPKLVGCVCFGAEYVGSCICNPTEMALRAWSSPSWKLAPMTPAQREWCLQEIDGVEGYKRADYEPLTDAELARGVLDAWRDYCRDKGLL